MNESINDEAVCRTAPATPGLSIIGRKVNGQLVMQRSALMGFLSKLSKLLFWAFN